MLHYYLNWRCCSGEQKDFRKIIFLIFACVRVFWTFFNMRQQKSLLTPNTKKACQLFRCTALWRAKSSKETKGVTFISINFSLIAIFFNWQGHSLSKIGLPEFYQRHKIGEPSVKDEKVKTYPRVFSPATNHYSWPKASSLLGIGDVNNIHIQVDRKARQDITSECFSKRENQQFIEEIKPCLQHMWYLD